jgi:5-methylcytosine-specific restriction enzyme subunit McrC
MTPEDRPNLRIAEYRSARTTAAPPTDHDLRLARQLQDAGQLAVRWLADGTVEAVANSWVGVVRFSALDVTVEPKLVGGELKVLRMLDYAGGTDLLRRLPTDRPLPAGGTDLFELVCLLLALEAEALLRDGILRDYRTVDDTLGVLRGRLRTREQFLQRFGRVDQLECRFDEYDCDTPDNQYVAAALHRAAHLARDRKLRLHLAGLHATLADVCEPPTTDPDHYRSKVTYNRRNDRYRRTHELADIVLRHLAFDDLFDTSSGRATAFLLDMNNVFENFVARLVTEALASTRLRVSTQRKLRAVVRNDLTGRTYSTVRPDLVVEDPATGRAVPVDVKYKTYEDKKVSTADIYQTFLYAYALGSDEHDRRAGILFPSTGTSQHRLSISPLTGPASASIVARGIDVPAALDALAEPGPTEFLVVVRDLVLDIWGLADAALLRADRAS